MIDETSGLPYYYHTKTEETQWERPQAFVIPLGVLQNTALGRRLSLRHKSRNEAAQSGPTTLQRSSYHRSRSYSNEKDSPLRHHDAGNDMEKRRSPTSPRASPAKNPQSRSVSGQKQQTSQRSTSTSEHLLADPNANGSPLSYPRGHPLAPIPGSPYTSDASSEHPSSARTSMSTASLSERYSKGKEKAHPPESTANAGEAAYSRPHSKPPQFLSYRSPEPQSLTAALELIALSDPKPCVSSQNQRHSSEGGCAGDFPNNSLENPTRLRVNVSPSMNRSVTAPASPVTTKCNKKDIASIPPSFQKPIPRSPALNERSISIPDPVSLNGKVISSPIYNAAEATLNLNPKMNRLPIDLYRKGTGGMASSLSTGKHHVLPEELSSDIQQFAESQFARQYFATHRTGFLFKRKIPVAQLLAWQKASLGSPLLVLNKALHKNALKIFKVIQHIMGDKDRDRSTGVRMGTENHISMVASINHSTTSLVSNASSVLLEEERWLLSEGLAHGELRDEVYCQVMKQLTNNPNPESIFRGWQLLCVLLITFPPSKDFEPFVRSFLHQATKQQEGRVDVMAKYCLRRLAYISRKGPRGKAPTVAEIETASDAAFHPSIFGETLDTIFRLQERTYPHMKVPIILPFLADGILALGGTKTEGIFRVPGDGDTVSDLKLRIDKGYYSLDGVEDPHVLASLIKLWLRELCDPLIPDEMYYDCIASARDPAACVQIVHRLPTINRRVVLFVTSFLQLFLEEKVQAVTKMTSPNLALVMAPNLLRCTSDSIAVVFTNAQYEHTFVHNLLLHLQCDAIDPDYIPTHGQGAIAASTMPPVSSHPRRRNY
ncbi:uncharacterized protein LAESUDRAFT_657523 [Laetiporus sulphureus 93-53]|uniref:RhoGAP-domain-containing protein n=1 Tax=Laetiporus sulphureus 93-53 TaxID=1314785 RepID=A0A165DD17_9APHY|nr:uncharacterized protein LAESUDRAFT_657523 [Laetiporus sulphureus 93-53]KZT04600.1 hypothetical protein LAESUDRAFT_657523 [Laetiporus sulphureus 93-53]